MTHEMKDMRPDPFEGLDADVTPKDVTPSQPSNRLMRRIASSLLRRIKKRQARENGRLYQSLKTLAEPVPHVPFIAGETPTTPALYTLHDAVLSYLDDVPGSAERSQLSRLMRQAKVLIFEDDVTKSLGKTVLSERGLFSIVHYSNHMFSLSEQPLWVEFSHKARRGGVQDDTLRRVGYLVAKDTVVSHHLLVFVAWQDNDDKLIVAQTLAHIRPFSHPVRNEDYHMQLMEMVTLSVPDSFLEEIRILNDIRAENDPKLRKYLTTIETLVASEMSFVMACVLATTTLDLQIRVEGDVSYGSLRQRDFFESIMTRHHPRDFFEDDGLLLYHSQ